jgi:hypothetical protein
MGSWLRQGARVARAALLMLATGVVGPGSAEVQHRGERHLVALDRLWLRRALPARVWTAANESITPLAELLQAARQRGVLAGWRVQRWPVPLVTAASAIWPEFALVRGPLVIGLLPLGAGLSPVAAAGLATAAQRRACLFFADHRVPASLTSADLLPLGGEAAVSALGAMLARRWQAAMGMPSWLTALMEAIQAAGSLAESDLAQRLDCLESQVGERLAQAPTADVVYVPGFGICTPELLGQASAVVREELAGNAGRLELARLGRRLQALVGRNEGLHALIGYVAGEVRLVA